MRIPLKGDLVIPEPEFYHLELFGLKEGDIGLVVGDVTQDKDNQLWHRILFTNGDFQIWNAKWLKTIE